MKSILLWLFLNVIGCFPISLLLAQNPTIDTSKSVHKEIETNSLEGITKANYYIGRLDDATAVEFTLRIEGSKCKGSMQYLTTKLQFSLEGHFANGQLDLNEIDAYGKISGNIVATLKAGALEGSWMNYNKTHGMHLSAIESTPQQLFSPCSDNKWFNRYADQYLQKPLEINIYRANNGSLSGSLWIGAEKRLLLFNGEVDTIGNYRLTLINPASDKDQGYLRGSLKNTSSLELVWVLPDGAKRFFRVPLQESLMSTCNQYADYVGSYDIIYPRLKQTAPASFFEKIASEWAVKFKHFAVKNTSAISPGNRNTFRSNGWTEITLWDEGVLSGFFTLSNSWDSVFTEVPFNFDLKKNKELELKDFFLTSFNVSAWMKSQVLKNKDQLTLYDKDEEFKKWADSTNFSFITIRKDGILLNSSFHPIYGRQAILLDWNTVKPYLRKDSAISHLLYLDSTSSQK